MKSDNNLSDVSYDSSRSVMSTKVRYNSPASDNMSVGKTDYTIEEDSENNETSPVEERINRFLDDEGVYRVDPNQRFMQNMKLNSNLLKAIETKSATLRKSRAEKRNSEPKDMPASNFGQSFKKHSLPVSVIKNLKTKIIEEEKKSFDNR